MSNLEKVIEHYGFSLINKKMICPMPKHKEKSGSFNLYPETESFYCYGCGVGGDSITFISEMDNVNYPRAVNKYREITGDEETFSLDREEEYKVGTEFNEEIHNSFKEVTGLDSKGYRGIKKEISQWFGVRYDYSTETSEVETIYYPATIDYELTGYKIRKHPKRFVNPMGEVGMKCDLFGQHRFRDDSNQLLIVGGEHDVLAAYQMLKENQDRQNNIKKTSYKPPAVVSGTVGENSVYNQIQNQYTWLNKFKKIIVCLDNDEAGKEASEKLCRVMPRGKVYVMNMRHKDPNDYLTKGNSQDFISDYWNAQPYSPAGVHASSGLLDSVIDFSDHKMLSLPPFLKKAEEMFGGGLVKNEITCLFANTSVGKSLFTDSMVVNWVLQDTDEVVGVLSLEATKDKWATNILSNYLGVRLNKMEGQERKDYLTREDVREKVNLFLMKEDGSPRFWVCDERGAEVSVVKEKILEMIIQLGVTILVVDVFSDIMASMSLEQQEELVSWFKRLIKEYPQVSVFLVCHTRKTDGKSELTEADIIGTSTIMKSAAQTFSLARDKLASTNLGRNSTQVTIHKNRHHSDTGPAGIVFFDRFTGKLYDLDERSKTNPEIMVD